MTPPRITPPQKHPTCEQCGSSGELIVYFHPQIFKAAVHPDARVRHHGLVNDAEPGPESYCGTCGGEIDVPDLKIG